MKPKRLTIYLKCTPKQMEAFENKQIDEEINNVYKVKEKWYKMKKGQFGVELMIYTETEDNIVNFETYEFDDFIEKLKYYKNVYGVIDNKEKRENHNKIYHAEEKKRKQRLAFIRRMNKNK